MLKTLALSGLAIACAGIGTTQPVDQHQRISNQSVEAIEGANSFHWIETDWGVIATKDDTNIASVLAEHEAAVSALEQHFNIDGLRGAVVDAALADQYDQIEKTFDLDWVMPWSFDLFEVSLDESPVEPTDEQKESIREQITQQLSAGGRSPSTAQIEAVYQQALAQFAEQNSGPAIQSEDNSVKPLRHEIAHKLFIAAVWPVVEGKPAYGGGAPDWLDEVAAILAEDELLTASRRIQVRDAARFEDLIPLDRFFSMQHPAYEGALEMVRRFKEANGDTSSSGVYNFTAEDFEAAGIDLDADAGKFYAQARGFIDYLESRAPDAKSLALITRNLKAGESLSDILETEGDKMGLPASIGELEEDFFTWLRQS